MNNIPTKLRTQIAEDPFMKDCCLRDDGMCEGRIEWHHVLIYGGRQVQERFAIVPACGGYHHKFANRKDIYPRFLKVALNRATDSELEKISKLIDYKKLRDKLNG